MSKPERTLDFKVADETPQQPLDRVQDGPATRRSRASGGRGRAWFAVGVVLLGELLGIGIWQHYTLHVQAAATAQRHRDFVPSVQVTPVRSSGDKMSVEWPGTTEAFEAANIFARASGYIDKRNVDIGDHVKAGQLLAQVTAPELDHQIAQAEATLAQMQAAFRQAQANKDLAQVTWGRDSKLVQEGWVTKQQGDTDRLTLQAQEGALDVAQANIKAEQAQLLVLRQQKAYQSVVAPFDGVITQRNIDIGSLVQADATSGTFMFTIMHSDVIRIQLYVPQDEAFGLSPGVTAVVRVPELPGRSFPGTVTRIATALQPGTRTLLTEIDVPNPDQALSPGIYCTVELQIPRKTPSLIVPSEAIIFNREGLSVAVVENGVAHIRKITEVRDLGTVVETSEGVKDGDQVILNPPVDLTDGHKVSIRNMRPAQAS
jgi:RND family efflux transporter MFP subunit